MGWKGTLRTIQASNRRYEREALRRQRELERQRKQLEKMQEMERAAYEVQVYENHIDVLSSIHKDCGNTWKWEVIQSANPPNRPIISNTNEKLARSNFEAYKPGLMDKMLKRVERKRNELAAAIEEGKRKDNLSYQEALKDYEQNYEEWKALCELAKKILIGDTDAYKEAIGQVDPFSEISEIGSSIKFNIVDSNLIEVALHVNGEDFIPNEVKTLLKSGKLSIKKMPKTRFYEIYQDYVCGAVIRVARELFALLPIEMTIITAIGKILNTKTGYIEEQPILSVAIPRKTFTRLNFTMLDPSDSMDNFLHHMKFLKTKGFQRVEIINPSDLQSL